MALPVKRSSRRRRSLGDYFVPSPKVIERMEQYSTTCEREASIVSAKDGELVAFKRECFWQTKGTLRKKSTQRIVEG